MRRGARPARVSHAADVALEAKGSLLFLPDLPEARMLGLWAVLLCRGDRQGARRKTGKGR